MGGSRTRARSWRQLSRTTVSGQLWEAESTRPGHRDSPDFRGKLAGQEVADPLVALVVVFAPPEVEPLESPALAPPLPELSAVLVELDAFSPAGLGAELPVRLDPDRESVR